MIITAFQRFDTSTLKSNENVDTKGLKNIQGRPIIMIYKLESDQSKKLDEKPKLVHYDYLNNENFPNINFIHPNVYAQNGNDLFYVIFEN